MCVYMYIYIYIYIYSEAEGAGGGPFHSESADFLTLAKRGWISGVPAKCP